ncbi:PQQ-dependent sugar dehydrogenase [Actinopolymorpha alba]|uniref:PQQ-dependent sugar dehydrogenase n=1 Tax=Actinopolymorpha alba TaxID=533267 RepID=UPI001ED99015|nr:PQQ-dependent sugar dehydrogenase [Actinopolymorpha alba]
MAALTVVAVGACGGPRAADSTSTASATPGGPPTSPTSGPPQRPAPAPARPGAAGIGVPTTPAATLAPRTTGTIATNLTSPWDLIFLPGGRALLSERDTALIKLITPGGDVRTVGKVAGVAHGGEGGLLGLALSPTYAQDHLLYAAITTRTDNRVVRMTFDGTRLGTPQVVFAGIPRGAAHHNGGRIRFGPDGYLYVPTGDGEVPARAQNKRSLGGKILRLTPDGEPAPGNPFRSAIWTYGHRNIEGLVWDPDGRLWAAEFGNHTADELNLISKAINYGWPRFEGRGGIRQGLMDPVAQWPVEENSPSGITYANGAIWMAGLRGERLWRIPVNEGRVTGPPEAYLIGEYGRLRTVARAPDGSLWLVTSNTDGRGTPNHGDDRILRLTLPR